MKAKPCLVCQHENAENALVCAKCGALFTVKIDLHQNLLTLPTRPAKFELDEDHTLFIYVMGDQKPLIFKNQNEVIFGRMTANTALVHVDLSTYGENRLGVSRRHAVIEYDRSGYTIRDLGSSNGTFLNDVLLIPHRKYQLQAGDKVSLAQLPLIVYFKEKRASQTEFYLTYYESKPYFSVAHLVHEVIPYLQALEALQGIANTAIEKLPHQSLSAFSLGNIKFDPKANRVIILAEGCSEAVLCIQEMITPYKKINGDLLKENPEEVPVETLAQTIAARFSPSSTPEQNQDSIQKLLPILSIFLSTPLDLSLAL